MGAGETHARTKSGKIFFAGQVIPEGQDSVPTVFAPSCSPLPACAGPFAVDHSELLRKWDGSPAVVMLAYSVVGLSGAMPVGGESARVCSFLVCLIVPWGTRP